jgi:hypothetical protein
MEAFFGVLAASVEASAGITSAVEESAGFVEALQSGDSLNILVEGLQAVGSVNDARHSYKKLQGSLTTLNASSSSLTTNSTHSSSSNVTAASNSTTKATVKWVDASLASKIGVSIIEEKYLIKLHQSQVLLVEDVVEAICELTYGSGVKISTGTHGILKGVDDLGYLIIHWLVDGIGELSGTPSNYLKKCNQQNFFKVGDVVQAAYDLRYTEQSLVPKQTCGTLKQLENGGSWIVDWWNGIAHVSTKQEYMVKCDQEKFYKVGDVVKAQFDLTWPTGEGVSAGTFGTLILWDMKDNTWDVNWWNGAGELNATQALLKKCHYTEYWLPEDVFMTSCNFDFGERGKVPKHSLCNRVEMNEMKKKQSKSKHVESKQVQSNQSEGNRLEMNEMEKKQSESKEAESKQSESKEAESKQSESKQSEGKQWESKHAESKQSEGKQLESKQVKSNQVKSNQADRKQSERKRLDPSGFKFVEL